ncbi:TMEM175 family protein [Agromyces sp. NPDC055661]
MTRLRTERGLDRLVNFSDATVAIAITVLLLPLVDIALEIEKLSLGDLFARNLGTIIAFAITFAVIARLWFSHHRLFEAAIDYDSGMIWVNFLWLASIVVMPFTANVLAHSDAADPGVNALYIGTVLSSSVALLWLVLHLRRHPALTSPGASQLLHFQDSVLTVVAFAVALVLSVVFPEVGMFWLLLLIPANVLGGVLHRRAAREDAPASP